MEKRWLAAAGLAAIAVAGTLPGSAEPGEPPQAIGVEAGLVSAASETVTEITANSSSGGSASCLINDDYLDSADGTVVRVRACRQANQPSAHPYEQYPEDALASLAFADAKAAEVLGMRLRERDPAAALRLIFRSAALAGGDTAPIRRYANAYPQPVAIDGMPVSDTVRMKFVLAAVAEILGDDASGREVWEAVIRRHSSDADTEIELLNDRTSRIVARMQRVREQVGSTPKTGG
jgi:hypothetical protein